MVDYKEGYIICDNSTKMRILEELSKEESFKNYTFMSIEELKKSLTFNVEDEGVIKLIEKYDFSFEVALSYIKELESLNGVFEGKKGLFLKEIYGYLDSNNLITTDNMFKERAKTIHFTFLNCTNSKRLEYIKTMLNEDLVEVIEPVDTLNLRHFDINTFNNIESEVAFVFKQIYDLVESGVDINNIKLCNLSSEYIFIVSRFAKALDIKLKGLNDSNILSTDIAHKFLELASIDLSVKEIIETLKDEDSTYLNSIIDLINRYSLYKYSTKRHKETYETLFTKASFQSTNYDNTLEAIKLEDIDEYKDAYIFLLDFNISVPRVFKDEGYLLDNDKEEMNIDTSLFYNIDSKIRLIQSLKNTPKLVITFSDLHSFRPAVISPLVKELGMTEIKHKNEEYPIGYSSINDNLYLAKACDNYVKYNEKNRTLDSFYFKDLPYNTYDNRYKGINKNKVMSLLNDKVTLSYSSMHTFLQCPFAYYLNNILRLDEFKSTLDAILGTFAHGVLEDFENEGEGFIFEESISKNIAQINGNLSLKDKFYIDKMKRHLLLVIDQIKEHKDHTRLKKSLCEKKMDVKLHDGSLVFKGFIDKLWYDDFDSGRFVAIIDYKTGRDVASIKNIELGENLQLPVYIYLLRNDEEFKDSKLVGFYLQKINIILPKYGDGEKEAQIKKNLTLEGYTNPDYIDYIDFTDGDYLKKYSLKKDGSPNAHSLLFDDEVEQVLIETVKKHIEETYQSIINADFEIKPKVIDKKNKSCEYCGFKDICFKTSRDLVYYQTTTEEEENADEDE